MKLPVAMTTFAFLLVTSPASPIDAGAREGTGYQQTYSRLTGQVVFDNERVMVQKFVIRPGEQTGSDLHRENQLLIFIKGGTLKSAATGRATLWRNGRVVWRGGAGSAEAGSTNSGESPIKLICVTLKPVAPTAASPGWERRYQYLDYPNIPGEDVFENDLVIVQRFIMYPGQWEGVHAHAPNTLYVFIKGGPWASRTKSKPQPATGYSPDGDVGWMPAIDIGVGHESGNIGTKPSEVVWVALKK